MKKWLSIIVPIYNAEPYLAECVDSLLNQDKPEDSYEVLLYDDGSTDGSLRIAREYGAKYGNVRVFTHPNAGVAETRNAGLREAVGEYVWFVDSDDYICENVLSVLYEWTERERMDMLIFDLVKFSGSRRWKHADFVIRETPVVSGRKAFLDFYYDPVPWNKLLRRAYVEENHLFFMQRWLEDSEWGSRCFYHAERVKAIPLEVVCYRVSDSSLSHSSGNQKNLLEKGMLLGLENHYKYMLDHPDNRFWMRALLLDLRRLHIALDLLECTREERASYVKKERDICRKIRKSLPASLRMDYVVIALCAVHPFLIIGVQRLLREAKAMLRRH